MIQSIFFHESSHTRFINSEIFSHMYFPVGRCVLLRSSVSIVTWSSCHNVLEPELPVIPFIYHRQMGKATIFVIFARNLIFLFLTSPEDLDEIIQHVCVKKIICFLLRNCSEASREKFNHSRWRNTWKKNGYSKKYMKIGKKWGKYEIEFWSATNWVSLHFRVWWHTFLCQIFLVQ